MTTRQLLMLAVALFAAMAFGLHETETGRQQAFANGAEYPWTSRDAGCDCGVVP